VIRIIRWIIINLLPLAACCEIVAQQQTIVDSPQITKNTDSFLRESATVMLNNGIGHHLGSGVIVANKSDGVWIASNHHVIGINKVVCVTTKNQLTKAGLVVRTKQIQGHQGLDVALIWMPSTKSTTELIPKVSETKRGAKDFPVVVATGFPTPLHNSGDTPRYTERAGLLIPLLKKPLQDGLNLAYTAAIHKGMSGGGIFLGDKLIGINSAHREPLWPGHWHDARGKEINKQLNKKLDLVSLGISSNMIKRILEATIKPTDAEISKLLGDDC